MTCQPYSPALTPLPEQAATPRAEELYLSALDLLAEGRAADAAGLLRESLSMDPLFFDALHALTRALQDAGEFDEAVAAAHRLIALDGDDVLAHTRLSILYQAKGMVPEAEAEATKARLLGWKQQLAETRDGTPSTVSTSTRQELPEPA